MPKSTSDNASASSGTIGPGGRPGGPKLEAILLIAIVIEASLLLYLTLQDKRAIEEHKARRRWRW